MRARILYMHDVHAHCFNVIQAASPTAAKPPCAFNNCTPGTHTQRATQPTAHSTISAHKPTTYTTLLPTVAAAAAAPLS